MRPVAVETHLTRHAIAVELYREVNLGPLSICESSDNNVGLFIESHNNETDYY